MASSASRSSAPAWWRCGCRPYARFGLLLAAVGFASLLGVLHEANGAAAYTSACSARTSSSRCSCTRCSPSRAAGSRATASRVLVVAAYADVLVLQAIAVLFDPLTR